MLVIGWMNYGSIDRVLMKSQSNIKTDSKTIFKSSVGQLMDDDVLISGNQEVGQMISLVQLFFVAIKRIN